jgi:hypothetical protein
MSARQIDALVTSGLLVGITLLAYGILRLFIWWSDHR